MSVKNYAFACGDPLTPVGAIAEQIRLSQEYRNTLVRIERDRRCQEAELNREYGGEVASLESQVEALEADLLLAREAGIPAEIKSVRKAIASLRIQLRNAVAQARVNPEAQAARMALEEDSRLAIRMARTHFSDNRTLYWGTYLAIEDAAKNFRRGAPPDFRPISPEGKLCVQLQKGLSWADALACKDTRLRIEMTTARRGVAWLRIGTISGRKTPIWARLPAIIHRQPSPDARIKWVHLLCRRVGVQFSWSLVLTIDDLHAEGLYPQPRCGHRVAVNPGWRIQPCGGLRVATWANDAGDFGHLILPASIVGRFPHADSLRSIRDRAFDEAREKLAQWLESPDHTLPDWLVSETAYLRQWKSPSRLAWLVRDWIGIPPSPYAAMCGRRVDHDDEIIEFLRAWRKQDRHLANYEAGDRKHGQNARTDLYRNFAAGLRNQYTQIVLAKTGQWRELMRLPDDDQPVIAAVRYNQRTASPGNLEEILSRSGTICMRVDASLATQRCHLCGVQNDFDAARYIVWTCTGCGETWDQDVNHCRNLLNRASAEAVDENPGGARDPQELHCQGFHVPVQRLDVCNRFATGFHSR